MNDVTPELLKMLKGQGNYINSKLYRNVTRKSRYQRQRKTIDLDRLDFPTGKYKKRHLKTLTSDDITKILHDHLVEKLDQ